MCAKHDKVLLVPIIMNIFPYLNFPYRPVCLSCSREFQDLQAQVISLPEELDQITQQYMRMNTQADMKQAKERQEETSEKLQSQHDTIVNLQKQMDVLPEISARLDNLTVLQSQVNLTN